MSDWTSRAFIVCTSHRGASQETQASMQAAGVPFFTLTGVSDTALARNMAFATALNRAKETGRDVIIFCDDDMTFQAPGLAALVDVATATGEAVSALYLLANGKAAARCVEPCEEWTKARWWTGLGLLVVPVEKLETMAARSEKITGHDGVPDFWAFTWSGPDSGRWMSEDYRFCKRLGGVILAPVASGHVKPVPLIPDAVSLEQVKLGGMAPKFDSVRPSNVSITTDKKPEAQPDRLSL